MYNHVHMLNIQTLSSKRSKLFSSKMYHCYIGVKERNKSTVSLKKFSIK